jgi:hypothetical protein
MKRISLLFVLLSTIVFSAQNFRAEPIYGTIELRAGFEEDPVTFEVTAGGSTRVQEELSLPPSCEGYIEPSAPDLSVNYEAGEFPLRIFVDSQVDTTLIINDPLGQWQCNDDAFGTNPAKNFNNPPSGQYDIWVGTFDPQRARATLYLTEK